MSKPVNLSCDQLDRNTTEQSPFYNLPLAPLSLLPVLSLLPYFPCFQCFPCFLYFPFSMYQFVMQRVVQQVASLLQLTSLDESKQLEFVERRTGIRPSGFVLAILVFLLIVTFISNATSLVVGIGCCLIPAYLTFLVLETSNRQSITRHLVYWVLFSLLQLLSPLLNVLPSVAYIMIRMATTVLLLHPDSLLAQRIYEYGIQPLLKKCQQDNEQNHSQVLEQRHGLISKGTEQDTLDKNRNRPSAISYEVDPDRTGVSVVGVEHLWSSF